MSASDATLWLQWQQRRDPDAFAEIVSRHSGMVYATCRRILRNAADAEDAAQECFVELVNGRIKVRSSLAPWLHTVAVRRALNRAKADGRRRKREEQFAAQQRQSTEVVLDDLMEHLDAAIAGLPEKLRGPVICRYLEGRAYEAIAQECGVAESTIRHQTNKGVEQIRAFLRRRRVPVAAGALAAALSQQGAQAASASLTATLGKLAISGTTATIATQTGGAAVTATSLGTLGGILVMKKIVVGAVIVAAALAGFWTVTRSGEPTRPGGPPAIPKEIEAKLRALEPEVGETTQEIRPVLVTSPVAVTTEKPVIEPPQADSEPSPPKPASISGRVVDSEGNPIPRATVDLAVGACTQEANKIRVMKNPAKYSATTRSDGTYRIDNIVDFGDIELMASADGFVPLLDGVQYGDDEQSPLLKRISAGDNFESADFTLLPAIALLKGRVVNQARVPIEGARIVLEKHFDEYESQGWRYAVSDQAGRFEMPLPGEGQCVLVVRKEGYGAGYFDDIQPSAQDLELMLEAGGAIAGRATTTEKTPLARRQVHIMAEERPGKVGNPWMATGWFTVITDDDGNYRLDDLSPDFTYTVRLPFPTHEKRPRKESVQTLSDFLERQQSTTESVEEFRFGFMPEMVMAGRESVEVRAGKTTRVDLVAEEEATKRAAIYGRVTDPATGDPVCPLVISAVSADYDPPLLAMAGTQPDGTYRMEIQGLYWETEVTVKTGHFHAPMPVGSGLYRNVEAQPAVTTLLLEPGGQEEVNFTMPASVTAPVRCVSTEGEPLQDVTVHWLQPDAEGRLTIYGLAPHMTHQLKVLSKAPDGGYVPRGYSQPFSGKPGETLPETTIVCDLSSGSLIGQIVLPEGIDECPVSQLICEIHYHALGEVTQSASVTPQGMLTVEEALPGACSILLYVPSLESLDEWWAFVENVEIVADQTTDLGDIVPNPPALEE